ncbi:fatty acid desaturase [Isosphaeraceae bacterium EP7]
MSVMSCRPSFDQTALQQQIRPLRRVDNLTNLAFLAAEYLTLATVLGGAIAFAELRAGWGLAWAWNVPVFAIAIVLVGAIQHRLAGLGHEASHYTLLHNKFANDLVADLFFMFPLVTTIHFYRLFHMAHHQYTNDPEHDPDLVNMGEGKQIHDLPMPRGRFVRNYYLRALLGPLSFPKFQWAYFHVNSLGKGGNVYMKRTPGGDGDSDRPRVGTVLGFAFILAFSVWTQFLAMTGRSELMVPSTLAAIAIGVLGCYLVPTRWTFHSPFRQAYSARFAGAVRISYYILAQLVLFDLRIATDGRSAVYFVALWLVPLGTSFSFFMLLRDTYQHGNADDGRLTNSRIFNADPFTRWAVFVYGQDVHVTHHLFPAIPHFRLRRLHALLKTGHAEYQEKVVEVYGTFSNDRGLPTILDVMTTPREEAGFEEQVGPASLQMPRAAGFRVGAEHDAA